MPSTLTYYGGDIVTGSAATPGLWNRPFSILSQDIDELNAASFASTAVVQAIASRSTQISSSASTGEVLLGLPTTLRAPGTLNVASDVSTSGALFVTSTFSVDGDATLRGDATFLSTLSAAGAATFDSTVTVVGDAKFSSAVSIDGLTKIESGLSVEGRSHLSQLELYGNWCKAVGSLESNRPLVFNAGGNVYHSFFVTSNNSATLNHDVSGSVGTFKVGGNLIAGWIQSLSLASFDESTVCATGANAGGYFITSKVGVGLIRGSGKLGLGGTYWGRLTPAGVFYSVTSQDKCYIGDHASHTVSVLSEPDPNATIFIAGPLAFFGGGYVNLYRNQLMKLREVTSADSSNLSTDEFALLCDGSNMTIAVNSNNTIWYFTSSASTIGA